MFALRSTAVLRRTSLTLRLSSTKANVHSPIGVAPPSSRSTLWQKYKHYLETYPLTTKCLTSAGIAGTGDVLCQAAFESKPFNVQRFATFTALGGVFIAPTLHVWYGFLNRVVSGTAATAVATRLALDQFVFAPTFLASFFGVLLVVSPNSDDATSGPSLSVRFQDKLNRDWWSAVQTNWVVWIPAQLLNFGLVPPALQVLFSNVVGLFWNAYMSYISYKPIDDVVAEDDANALN
ncbi:hypothetical protein H310_11725 [Aphanomyces invadans]|uniref:Protein SYM1 n=1 Tax=Aphanomyces invadans TaxID=157072 RepID=A0A024TL89_9STRA|nr:hypothetical protein H310_11725 [Aphanomyces invadans]ETV94769.1 hypothetical protein H310_11725 [Aphanomyces invadans]|eukprot:XP_008876714.1 hypothetical protein H310_11725 [Aphanomyces invadans]